MRALGAAPHTAEQGERKYANWAQGRSRILAGSFQTRPWDRYVRKALARMPAHLAQSLCLGALVT